MDPSDIGTDVEEVVREDVFPLAEDEDETLLDNLPATLNHASAVSAAATRTSIPSWRSRFNSNYDAKPAKCSIDKARRMKTNPHIQDMEIHTAPDTFAANAFKSIVRNLDRKHINTNRLVQGHFSWMLPGPSTTPDQLNIFYALQNFPIVVPNGDLARILKLERCTLASLPTASGQHFYSRAWEFTAQQLTAIVQLMVKNSVFFDECTAWMEAMIVHNTPRHPCTFTIRYIGTVKGPHRPIDRYLEDLRDRKSASLGDFLNAVEQLFPEVAAAVQVHLITEASITEDGPRFVAEDTESVLIELFHHRTLLNRHLRDYFSTFVPGDTEASNFERLNTRFYAGFYEKALSAVTQPQITSALLDHFDEVQLWANDHPGFTGTGTHIFDDSLKKILRKQATPMFYQRTTIMVLLGEAITLESYVDTTSFLGGNSRSGRVTVDMLSRLASTEEHNAGQPWDVRCFQYDHVPFVDLWQWLWRRNTALPQALSFISQYLSIVRPLIVLTLGRDVASVVKSNLLHDKGLDQLTTMTSVAGELSIQYYQDPDNTTLTEDENNAFIAIPHFHPGSDRYHGQAVGLPFLEFIDLTWQLSLHVADVACKYLDENDVSGQSRKQQCREILQRVEQQRANDPAMQTFMDNFRRAKEAVEEALIDD
jgi:hypothetical protein